MNSKHRKVLAAIFADPVSGTIAWEDIERLLIALDCVVIEGRGSRVRFVRTATWRRSTARIRPGKRNDIRSATSARS